MTLSDHFYRLTLPLRPIGRAIGFVSACLAVAACDTPVANKWETNQVIRQQLFLACLKALPAGPQSTRYNDWDEVVDSCANAAYYQAQICISGPCRAAQGVAP